MNEQAARLIEVIEDQDRYIVWLEEQLEASRKETLSLCTPIDDLFHGPSGALVTAVLNKDITIN